MASRISNVVVLILSQFLVFSTSCAQTTPTNIIQCLYKDSSFPSPSSSHNVVYFPTNSSYSSLLDSRIQNKRFLNSSERAVLKPVAIVKAMSYSQVQATVKCGRKSRIPVRTRSGGHDYEGLSYRSRTPFVLLDLQNLNGVNVSVAEKSAWVQTGATLGEVYYWINQKSPNHGFSAGTCPTVGAGGHISGGGFGTLSRKYGLAADNVVDALIVDAEGRILDRKSMGEELFWAIRGGGGASFGVILAWKITLLEVPPAVTVFMVSRRVDQGGTDLAHKWQTIGAKFGKELFLRLFTGFSGIGENRTVLINFEALYQGRADQLVAIVNQSFPELGLRKEDCSEVSWIESVLYFAGRNTSDIDSLRTSYMTQPETLAFSKATSDYVTQPISKPALELLWKWCLEEGQNNVVLLLEPYGGRMDEIAAADLPFPHRKGILYSIQYVAWWSDAGESANHIRWIRRLYDNMTPYVSQTPRRAYINYKDLYLGTNKVSGVTSFSEADRQWGSKYFDANFRRLAMIKRMIDPQNYFKDEQSVPPF